VPIVGGGVPLFDVFGRGVGPPDLLDGGGDVGFDDDFHGVPPVWDIALQLGNRLMRPSAALQGRLYDPDPDINE
jgi:hypothetical protein